MFCKLVLPSNEIHKLSVLPNSYEELCQVISAKLNDRIPKDFVLRYKDSDEELITLANDEDLATAVLTANSEGLKTLKIFILPSVSSPDIQKITQNLSLPRIPETLEKSRSSFGEVPFDRASSRQADENDAVPSNVAFPRFDLNKIQKTRSVILDDVETVNSMTPFSEKPDGTTKRRVFTFQRIDSFDFPSQVQETPAPNGILSDEQVKAIEALLETRLVDKIQDHITTIARDLVAKLNEECGFLNNSSFQGGLSSKNIGNSNAAKRNDSQLFTELSQEKLSCNSCETEITGIKYICLACPSFFCCESCEHQVNHPHPLLKVRPPRKQNTFLTRTNTASYVSSTPKANPTSTYPYGVKSCGRYPGAKTGLMSFGTIANIPQAQTQYENSNPNLSTQQPQKRPAGQQLRRGNSLGSIMNLSSSSSKNYRSFGDSEPKYKAAITKSTIYDIINVRPDVAYNVQLTIRNTGDEKWVDSVKLVCINGLYKGNEVDVSNLLPAEEQVVTLTLRAPIQVGRQLSQWKLHSYEDDIPRPFGKAVCVDTDVSIKEKPYREETTEASEENEEDEISQPPSNVRKEKAKKRLTFVEKEAKENDRSLMTELRCSEQNIVNARMLNDMFPGDIKEKVDFVKNFETNLEINDLVSAYLVKISRTNKKRTTWANNQRISKDL